MFNLIRHEGLALEQTFFSTHLTKLNSKIQKIKLLPSIDHTPEQGSIIYIGIQKPFGLLY